MPDNMQVDWNMSIGKCLSLDLDHPCRQEIEKIKAHIKSMGFKFKGVSDHGSSDDDHCRIEVISSFLINFSQSHANSITLLSPAAQSSNEQLTFLSQTCIVRFSPRSPLRDLLHELDHMYQLIEDADRKGRPYLKATRVNISLKSTSDSPYSLNTPYAMVNLFFDDIMNNDNLNVKPWSNSSQDIDSLDIRYKSKDLTSKQHARFVLFVNTFCNLNKQSKGVLFESLISRFDNEEMEINAYTREIQRYEDHPNMFDVGHEELTRLKYMRDERYLRGHYTGITHPNFYAHSWGTDECQVRLKTLPHVYFEQECLPGLDDKTTLESISSEESSIQDVGRSLSI